jgi:subtilisin family serine protease
VDRVFEHALTGFSARMTARRAAALAADPRVAYVEEDGEVRLETTQTGATWGIDRVDQAALPLSTTYSYTNTGLGVTAYIIDTGIRFTHSEFGGRAVGLRRRGRRVSRRLQRAWDPSRGPWVAPPTGSPSRSRWWP